MKYTKIIDIGGNKCAISSNGETRRVATFTGNTTRTLPTYEDGARDGDELIQTDTRKIAVFNEDTMDWDWLT